MKNIFALPLGVLWLLVGLSLPSFGAALETPLGMPDFSHSGSALTVSKGTAERTTIRLENPEVLILDSTADFEEYQLFVIPGEPFDYKDGCPALPQITRLYRIPNTGSVELRLTAAEFDTLSGVHPYPLQIETARFRAPLAKDAAVYRRDDWYPRDVAVIGTPMVYRDFRVVAVTLYPVQVNPVTGQARVYSQLDAEIVANDQPGENELLRTRPISRDYARAYASLIANLDDNELDDTELEEGSYLIICKNSTVAMAWSDSLANWKRRLGYTVTIDARANWNAVSMQSAIQAAYNNWDPPLEHVCLMGDPSSTAHGVPTGNGTYDHGFALLAGSDDLEDIGIGRLPAQTDLEFATINAKLMAYERSPLMSDTMWYHRAFLYAGYGYNVTSNEITMRWGRRQFERFTAVDSVYIATHSGNVNPTLIATRLNQGVSYFLWRGTVVGEMQPTDANQTNNGAKLPVVLTITCGSGDYNIQHPCVTESWILAGSPTNMKGGVCGIGTATWSTHVQYNNTVAGGLIYGIANLGIQHLGLALGAAKAQLHAAFPTDGNAVNFSTWNNLMGEPSLSLWTDKPVVMTVTYPGTVDVGTRRIRPQVTDEVTGAPIADALVVLLKGDECVAKALTDAGGFADVPVTVNTAGTMTLTVSKHNHKPFLADITCVDAAQMVSYSSHTFDDDNGGGSSGNADGILNPGETVDMNIALRNFGTSQTGTTISAVLTSSNPHVTVVNGTRTFPNIAPGDTALNATPFRISISPSASHGELTILTLAVTASGLTTNSSIRVECIAGDPVFMSFQLFGGNGDNYLQPGESATLQVTVRNDGEWPMLSVSGLLQSVSSYVTVSDPTGSFGNIMPDASGSNLGSEFSVTANQLAYSGYPAAMLLILTAADGFADSVRFTLPLGQRASTDPTGPDAYGYFAYDNTDVNYEFYRPFEYVSASATGSRLTLNDPGIEEPNTPPYAVWQELPFTFRFYGEEYDTITVCSNGWAAFGNQSDQDQFRNYPIPAQQAPDALLAPFWDDLRTQAAGDTLGVYWYFDEAGHRLIIQWKARAVGSNESTRQDFELILLDPEHYPTRDGNGIVVFQYWRITETTNGFNDIHYSTVGIAAPGSLVGLQYRFNNTAAPGAADLVQGRSIVISTESRADFGNVTGTITDAETSAPLPGVIVSLDGLAPRDTTDANGQYFLPDILIGTYSLRAHRVGYNDGVVENTVILTDSTITVDVAMLHPELALSVNQIDVTLPDEPEETSFHIQNDGNGVLDFAIGISYAPDETLDERWNFLAEIGVSDSTVDPLIMGCEFVGDYWWVTGGGGGQGNRSFYRFDLEGNYVGSLPQPSNAGLGWFDMAWDGQYIYGSNGPVILGIDETGAVQDTIPSPLNPTRALAYDPALDHFWVADYLTDVYEIDRAGTIIRQFATGQQVTGLAWHATDDMGYKLYIYGRDASSQHARVWRMHPVSGQMQYNVELDRIPGDFSGGCTITAAWNSTLVVFAGILQHPAGDRMGVWELDFNTTWIDVAPLFGTVSAGASREIELRFNPETLRNATYRVNLTITNNTANPTVVLPVSLTVNMANTTSAAEIAREYSLDQNYPNPFNNQTTFRYSLLQPGLTTLRIYNLLGQEVATVVNGFQDAGQHTVNFAANQLASGVYLYTIESGTFRHTRKLVLLK